MEVVEQTAHNLMNSVINYTGGRQRFEDKFNFQRRKEESNRILAKYPDRIPIICQRSKRAREDIPDVDRIKYLVPGDLSVANFMYVIRKRIKIGPEKSIYMFIGDNIIPSYTQLLLQIYEEFKDNDGFLYINYAGENTFG